MSEAIASSMANAAQSLRETAKWLVGGVALTTSGVFAGSPLTSLGSLDPVRDTGRLSAAAVGGVVGLIALACIFGSAIRVLTRESMTINSVAESTDKEIATLRVSLENRYRMLLPKVSPTLAGYAQAVDEALKTPTDPASAELIKRANDDGLIISADASFQLVRKRFDKLIGTLKWATILAIVGFGLFAWAANPPKPSIPTPNYPIIIQTPSGKQLCIGSSS